MNFWEWLALSVTSIGTGASIFGVLLSRASRFNGEATRALIRDEAGRSQALLGEIRAGNERGDQRAQELLREGDQRSQDLIRDVHAQSEATHRELARILEKISEKVSR